MTLAQSCFNIGSMCYITSRLVDFTIVEPLNTDNTHVIVLLMVHSLQRPSLPKSLPDDPLTVRRAALHSSRPGIHSVYSHCEIYFPLHFGVVHPLSFLKTDPPSGCKRFLEVHFPSGSFHNFVISQNPATNRTNIEARKKNIHDHM